MNAEKHMKQKMIYDDVHSDSNVIEMCKELYNEHSHALIPQAMVQKIRCDINDVKQKYEAGEIAEEEKDMITENH